MGFLECLTTMNAIANPRKLLRMKWVTLITTALLTLSPSSLTCRRYMLIALSRPNRIQERMGLLLWCAIEASTMRTRRSISMSMGAQVGSG